MSAGLSRPRCRELHEPSERPIMHSNSALQKPNYRVEREFGLLVGGALVVLGGWWIYRGKLGSAAYGFLGAGMILVVLGAVFPRALSVPYRMWMALGEALSVVTTAIILVVVFFVVITPVGIAKRLAGWDPLRRRGTAAPTYWKPYSARQRDRRHYEKMF